MSIPRIVIFVRDGVLAGVTADSDVEVAVMDFDAEENETELRDPVDGEPVNAWQEQVLIDKKRVDAHFVLTERE